MSRIELCNLSGIKLSIHTGTSEERIRIADYFRSNDSFARHKEMFNRKVCGAHKLPVITIPYNYEIIKLMKKDLHLIFDYEMDLLIKEIQTQNFTLNNIKKNSKNIYDERLRPYQNKGVAFIHMYKDVCLFWEQRTGKTPTTIVAMRDINKVIIAIPAGHIYSWVDEWKVWGDEREVIVNNGTPKKREIAYGHFNKLNKCVMIISYKTLSNDILKTQMLYKYDYLVIDEAHFLRNAKTKQSRGLLKARKLAEHSLLLTGTPATNSSHDVIPLLIFVKSKEKYEKWFIDYFFFAPDYNHFSQYPSYRNVMNKWTYAWAEFLGSVSFMIKLKEVMKWIPKEIDKVERVVPISKQLGTIRELHKFNSFFNKDKTKIHRVPNIMVKLMRLLQLSLDTDILEVGYGGAKTDWLKEYLNAEENFGKNIIVWSHSKKYLKLLQKHIPKTLLFSGDLNAMEKKAISDKYMNTPGAIMLTTIQSGCTGWTWDNTDTMIFASKTWSVVEYNQAIKRATPTTKEKIRETPLLIIDLFLDGGIDDYVEEALANKWTNSEITANYNQYLNNLSYIFKNEKNVIKK